MRSEKGLENKQKYDAEYVRTHYKRISLNLPLQEYDTIKEAAAGTPVNTYIKTAIREKIARDNDTEKGKAP